MNNKETLIPTWLNQFALEITNGTRLIYHSGRENRKGEIQFEDITIESSKFGEIISVLIKGKRCKIEIISTRFYTETNNVVIEIAISE